MKDMQLHEGQLHKETMLQRASTDLVDKASDLTVFCRRDSSPHLLVTSAQLIRPGIGRNVSWAVGDLTSRVF